MSDRFILSELKRIDDKIHVLINGYLQKVQESLFSDNYDAINNETNYYDIPNVVRIICLAYYYCHKNENKDDENNQNKSKETNILKELQRGSALLKYPRYKGFPHFKFIELSSDNLRIQWYSTKISKKPLSKTCILIKDIDEIIRGQKTETFQKWDQPTLEKSSFSIVYKYGDSCKTLDIAAKSIDECEMWIKCISKLMEIYGKTKNENDLRKLKRLCVGTTYKPYVKREKPRGGHNGLLIHPRRRTKIDPVELKKIEQNFDNLCSTYNDTVKLSKKIQITGHCNIEYILDYLRTQIDALQYEINNVRDTELLLREVWRENVLLCSIKEKIDVLIKYSCSNTIFY